MTYNNPDRSCALLMKESSLSKKQKASLTTLRNKLKEAETNVERWLAVEKKAMEVGSKERAWKVLDHFLEKEADIRAELVNLQVQLRLIPEPSGSDIPKALLRKARPVNKTKEAMLAMLAGYTFPTTTSEYEIPGFNANESNPYFKSVQEAGIKRNWCHQYPVQPDLVVSNLDEKYVRLTRLTWSDDTSQFRSCDEFAGLDFESMETSLYITGPFGSGKTRYLFETCHRHWGIYLTAGKKGRDAPGSNDFAEGLLHSLYYGTEPFHREKLIKHIHCILLARCLVLEAARAACPNIQPQHWLSLQLYPFRFIKNADGVRVDDVFRLLVTEGCTVQSAPISLEDLGQSPIKFIAVDNVERIDKMCVIDEYEKVDTFLLKLFGRGKPSKREILAESLRPSILSALDLIPHVVIAGTGTGVEWTSSSKTTERKACKTLVTVSSTIDGCGTINDAASVINLLQKFGVNDAEKLDPDVLERFTGRPGFAIQLAKALLMGSDHERAADDLIFKIADLSLNDFKRTSPEYFNLVTHSTKAEDIRWNPYEEACRTARRYVLDGDPVMAKHGDWAFEAGVCLLKTKTSDSPSTTSRIMDFVIKEPLVIEAFFLAYDAKIDEKIKRANESKKT